jgi:hypothetical protein
MVATHLNVLPGIQPAGLRKDRQCLFFRFTQFYIAMSYVLCGKIITVPPIRSGSSSFWREADIVCLRGDVMRSPTWL